MVIMLGVLAGVLLLSLFFVILCMVVSQNQSMHKRIDDTHKRIDDWANLTKDLMREVNNTRKRQESIARKIQSYHDKIQYQMSKKQDVLPPPLTMWGIVKSLADKAIKWLK